MATPRAKDGKPPDSRAKRAKRFAAPGQELEAALAPGHRLGRQEEDFPYHGDVHERRAAHVEWRRDLDHVTAGQIQPQAGRAAYAASLGLLIRACGITIEGYFDLGVEKMIARPAVSSATAQPM